MGQRGWSVIVACLCFLPSQRTWGEAAIEQEAKAAAPTPGSTSDCGMNGQACCANKKCFSFMLECVKDRCQESHMVHVYRDGGTFTERGVTTKVEVSGEFKLMTTSWSGRFGSGTLYHDNQIVWTSDRSGAAGETHRSTPITLEEAKRMYLGAQPRFDDGPPVHLNLMNVPFRDAAEFFLKLTHQPFNLSEPCRGTMTILSDVDLKPADAFSVFAFTLNAFQLQMEGPLQEGPTIHNGNVSGCACTLDGDVMTRVFALHHLTRADLKGASPQLTYAMGGHMLSEGLFVVTDRPEVIRQIGFWLEKQDRLDAAGKPVFLPDPFPRSRPFRGCPIAF